MATPLPTPGAQQVPGAKRPHMARKTTKINNPQPPKTRPPRGFRDRFLPIPATLPFYTGPYTVGTMEIEVPVRQPRHFSDITRNKHHVLQLETVLMTIYYPAAFGSGVGPDPAGHKKWSRLTWLPRPRIGTARGYGYFGGVPFGGWPAVPFFALTTMFTKLPAYRNAHLAQHWPPEKDVHSKDGFGVKSEAGSPPEGESQRPKFPLMFFSHGLGGTRTMYSCLCGEFASYGFICVAVEHRDGSGPVSFVNHEKEGYGSRQEREKTGEIDHNAHEQGKQFDEVKYIFPKDNPYDTSPHNEKGVDVELRNAQLELRIAEIEEAYDVMQKICSGHGEDIAKINMRRGGYAGSSSHGLDGVRWSDWKDAFHLEEVTMLGHSFGAATTVEVLRVPDRMPWVSAGVIYDIWGAAVRSADHFGDDHRGIHRPILAINSEAFAYWDSNFSLVSSLVKEARSNGALGWCLTVRGTVHVSQSDFALLYPRVCSYLLKMTANPQRAIDLNVNATLEFLKTVMPSRLAQINRSIHSERLLESSQLISDRTELPEHQIHQPDQRYIAIKLSIPHEWVYRMKPSHLARRRNKAAQQNANSSADEIWMHIAPTKTELRAHGVSVPDSPLENSAPQESEDYFSSHPAEHTASNAPSKPLSSSSDNNDNDNADVDGSRQRGSNVGTGVSHAERKRGALSSQLQDRVKEATGGAAQG